jgi:hypothetical protein
MVSTVHCILRPYPWHKLNATTQLLVKPSFCLPSKNTPHSYRIRIALFHSQAPLDLEPRIAHWRISFDSQFQDEHKVWSRKRQRCMMSTYSLPSRDFLWSCMHLFEVVNASEMQNISTSQRFIVI